MALACSQSPQVSAQNKRQFLFAAVLGLLVCHLRAGCAGLCENRPGTIRTGTNQIGIHAFAGTAVARMRVARQNVRARRSRLRRARRPEAK